MHGKPKSISKRTAIRVAVAQETDRAIALARRVGKRLRYQMSQSKTAIPGDDFVEAAKWYSRTLAELGRLVTTDEIGGANADKSASELTPEEEAEEVRIMVREHLESLKHDELCTLLAELGVAELVNAGSTNAPTGAPSEGFS